MARGPYTFQNIYSCIVGSIGGRGEKKTWNDVKELRPNVIRYGSVREKYKERERERTSRAMKRECEGSSPDPEKAVMYTKVWLFSYSFVGANRRK